MSIKITLLGTGTSAGVPLIGCTCAVCTSDDPRDRRDRPGAMVRYNDPLGAERTVLIDTTPDLRHQMLRHKVMRIDGVVYTHGHADHIFGIDDLRRFNAVMDAAIDIYAERNVLDNLGRTFRYIFEPHNNVNQSFSPRLIGHPSA
jgi:phosphoribosyl 1,2-cyclic phosphate phosphodiesterase